MFCRNGSRICQRVTVGGSEERQASHQVQNQRTGFESRPTNIPPGQYFRLATNFLINLTGFIQDLEGAQLIETD